MDFQKSLNPQESIKTITFKPLWRIGRTVCGNSHANLMARNLPGGTPFRCLIFQQVISGPNGLERLMPPSMVLECKSAELE
jgi:hypothetical protein